jgi:hypothetical protein
VVGLARLTAALPGVDVVIDTEGREATDVAAEIFRQMRERGIGTA